MFCCIRPYKDPVLITAQVLAIVGMCLTWVAWWNILISVTAFILLQVAWCCKINKCGLITGGVFCVLSALTSISTGVFINIVARDCYEEVYDTVQTILNDPLYNDPLYNDPLYNDPFSNPSIDYNTYNDDYNDYIPDYSSAVVESYSYFCGYGKGIAVMSYIGGVVMLLAGIFTFVFACGYCIQKFQEGNGDAAASASAVATKVEDQEATIHAHATCLQNFQNHRLSVYQWLQENCHQDYQL